MSNPDLVLIGHPFSAIGMAEHARSAWRAFKAAGVTPGLLDVYGMDRGKDPDFEREFASHVVPKLSEKVNFFCLNANEVDQAMGVLEHQGSGPAFDPAHALYLAHGFEYCGPFADYEEDPFSRFMTLAL